MGVIISCIILCSTRARCHPLRLDQLTYALVRVFATVFGEYPYRDDSATSGDVGKRCIDASILVPDISQLMSYWSHYNRP